MINPRLAPLHLQHRQGTAGQQEGPNADGQIGPENPTPGGRIRHPAADDRPGDARHRPGTGHVTLIPPTLTRRDHIGNRRLRHRHQPGPAHPLQRTGEDQLHQALRQAAQDRGKDEQHDGRQQQSAPAVDVRQFAIDRGGDGGGEQIGRHDPSQMPEAMQIGGNRGHCRDHHGLIDGSQEDAQQNAGNHPADLLMREDDLLWSGGIVSQMGNVGGVHASC